MSRIPGWRELTPYVVVLLALESDDPVAKIIGMVCLVLWVAEYVEQLWTWWRRNHGRSAASAR